ncbi:MAG: bifunctional aminoglycoside phosphotransferase/ATP-binding protein [Methylococcaceae bacterium]
MGKTPVNNQTALDANSLLIKSLCKSEAYEHEVSSVKLIETHISWVLLTGQYAYKIKKPVNFGFLDFSTLEKRRYFCHEEVRLNQRLAIDVYLEVVPITGRPDHPKIGGAGEAIEYAVKMIQFPSEQILRERAKAGLLGTDEIDQITKIVANFHETVEKASEQSGYGEPENIQHWFVENFHHIKPLLNDDSELQQLQAIEIWGNNEWHSKSHLMQLRRQQGYVRDCHGDLHLGNMTLINGKVTLFDCIEFNPMLRWIDVISEVAFLVIDLLYFGYSDYAYRFLNRYLQDTGDYHGLALLRYYLVYRAMVRAKVALLRMTQQQNGECQQARFEYAVFANLGERFSKDSKTVLIITHGFSGSGKSTFASQLAEKIGALQIRSDIERKRLFGYRAQENTCSSINSGLYTQEAGLKTYQRLVELAKAVIVAGFSVIIDAAFLKAEQRDLFRQLASVCHVQFFIVDFQASNEELCRRIRQRQNDISEATVDVLHQQQQSAQALYGEELNHVITINTENSNALDTLLTSVEVH